MQYRMHPSISLFPNKEFYGGLIQDASTVKERNYQKLFLQGNMYGPYSFINVASGKEEFNNGGSKKNLVEVAVVSEVVASLFKGMHFRNGVREIIYMTELLVSITFLLASGKAKAFLLFPLQNLQGRERG
jgi:superfamily I DNA and/or RNA helicase